MLFAPIAELISKKYINEPDLTFFQQYAWN